MLEGLHKYETFSRGLDVAKLDHTIYDVVELAFRKLSTVRAPTLGGLTVRPRA